MPAVKIKPMPMKLSPKPWVDGYVLDYHTISSTPTGDPYYRFDTKRTEIGELLFRMKYRAGGNAVLADIVVRPRNSCESGTLQSAVLYRYLHQ
jgi:hypothetical protein